MEGVHAHDVVLVNGDLNAKVGNDNIGVERIMGNNGCGTCNENGNLLIEFCGLNDLVIGGTLFQHKEIHKLTWTSPNRRDKNQIDHLMINGRWRHSLNDVSVKRGADCGSDHFLIISKIKLKLKKAPKINELSRKTFDLQRLKDNKIRQKFNTEVKNRYQVLRAIDDNNENMGENITEIWDNIKDIYTKTAEKVLGLKNRKRKQWLSDKTWENIKERKAIKIKLNASKSNRLKTKLQSDYRDKDKEVKKGAKNDRRNYVEELANEAEEASKRGELSVVYKITRQLCGKSRNNDAPVLSKEGKLLTTDKEKLDRWAEHFKTILNRAETNNDIPDIQPFGDALEIDTEAVCKDEIQKAIRQLKNGKAPGIDNISAELLKSDLQVNKRDTTFSIYQHMDR